ncbi:MAG: glycosyltransferase [Acidimicrobiales bacterium]|jgi:glycosyltransferase involved in cell wall biosynthesis/O-antigen/teichoic acid export membrane protein
MCPRSLTAARDPAVDEPCRSRTGQREVEVGSAWLLSSMVGVSALNYLFTLSLMWFLPVRAYAVAASVSALLLICGTVATASAPWVLAQEVANGRSDAERRRAAVSFCFVANLVQGVIGAGVTALIASRYAGGPVLGAVAGSVILIFAAATAIGYLQGFERFRLIATLRLAEVVAKIGAGLFLVSRGAGAGGAIAGYAVGAAVVAGVGIVVMAPDIRLRFASTRDRHLWSRAHGILSIQAGIAVLASADLVLGSLLVSDRAHLAIYQVSLIVARVPMVLASAISIAVFSRLSVGRRSADSAGQVRAALALFAKVTVPVVVVAATLPAWLTTRIFPSEYHGIEGLLPWTAMAGGLMGAANLLSTFFQSQNRFRRPLQLLGFGLVVHITALVVGLESDGITGLAIGSAIGAGVVAALLLLEARSVWAGSCRGLVRASMWGLATAAPLLVLRAHPVLWMAWAALGAGPPVVVTVCKRAAANPSAPANPSASAHRPRLLHLAFEDPRAPGAGGGSVRTHEINRRLAERWDITAVCARYPGSADRVEDGVRYVHVGRNWGHWPSLLTYFMSLPLALRRYGSDLVVEDFAAPFGSIGIPWMTRRPVVGVVQWLFAAQMKTKYHLPFPLVERLGTRSHRRLIAVSADLSEQLRLRNPRAEVTTVRNGLDDTAFAARHRPRADVVYLGRLDVAQKGLDLLLDAYARVVSTVDCDLLLAGNGPDEALLRARVGSLHLGSRVRFLGRVADCDRFDLLAGARVVVMPSRHETFGMVALEAQAVGTPVLSFEIPCLRELNTAATGVSVAPFDVGAFASALAGLVRDPQRCSGLGAAASAAAKTLRWEELALRQEDVYLRAVREAAVPRHRAPSRRRRSPT